MLVIYNETGFIHQCIMQAECTLEVLSERYAEMGVRHLLYDGDGDIFNLYVDVSSEPHRALRRPEIAVDGENRPVKADGVDALEFTLDPPNVRAQVFFNNAVIHDEQITDGKLEFAIDLPGTYVLSLGAEFPYLGANVTIEAVE